MNSSSVIKNWRREWPGNEAKLTAGHGKIGLVSRIHGLGTYKSILGLGKTRANADVREARSSAQIMCECCILC